MRIVHADSKAVSDSHGRMLRETADAHASTSQFHSRSFQRPNMHPLMSIARRTLAVETAEESNGHHGGRYLHEASAYMPGVGHSKVRYNAQLRNDTIVLEERPEVIRVECTVGTDDLNIVSAVPISLQPGQPVAFEQGWGCAPRKGEGIYQVTYPLGGAAGSTTSDLEASGQTVLIVQASIPSYEEDAEGVMLWVTRCRAEVVSPNMAAQFIEVDFALEPEEHEGEGEGRQLRGFDAPIHQHAGSRELTGVTCTRNTAGLMEATVVGLDYDCSVTLFEYGFNWDFGASKAKDAKLQIAGDDVYLDDS